MIEKERVLTEREFMASESQAVVRGRVSAFLQDAGYREISGEPLRFERGSERGTPFAFTPKKWHSVVTVVISGKSDSTAVKATFDVDKTGQMVTAREALFWDKEVDGLEGAAKGMPPPASTENQAASRTRRENLLMLAVLLLCIVVVGALVIGVTFILPRTFLPIARIVLPLGALWLAFKLFSKFQEKLNAKALAEDGNVPPPPVQPK